MNLKNNVRILSKNAFKWTWRKRFYSSMSLFVPKVDQNLSNFKKLKYPESMFVHSDDVASKCHLLLLKIY